MNLNQKFSKVPQPNSVPYSDDNGSLVDWLDNDSVTRQGNTFNGNSQLTKTDGAGKLPASVIPSIAIVDIFTVNSQAEMLALDAQRGDLAIRTDLNSTFILSDEPASTLTNWIELHLNLPIFTGATSTDNGTQGLVLQPTAGQQTYLLCGDGTWKDIGTVLHTDLNNLESALSSSAITILAGLFSKTDLSNVDVNGTPKLIPAGGSLNQVLAKLSSNDYATQWLTLANVAISGSYNDLLNKPTIPSVTSDLTNDSGFITNSVSNLTNYYLKTETDTLLNNKATISELTSHIDNISNPHNVTATQISLGNVDNTSDLDKPISTATQTALDLKANTSSLATVAISGSYNDLLNKPTLVTNLDDLSDVVITSVTSGQGLLYNGTNWINSTISSSVAWGNITGTLSAQTDLQSALNLKANQATTYTKTEVDTALGGKQTTSNLVTSISSTSTDVQYPSAKCVYDIVGNIEALLAEV